jgi:hypothetical protein
MLSWSFKFVENGGNGCETVGLGCHMSAFGVTRGHKRRFIASYEI